MPWTRLIHGSCMTVHEARDVRRPAGGRMADLLKSGARFSVARRRLPGAILTITEVEDPPLRLLPGSAACTLTRAADEAKFTSNEQRKELTSHSARGTLPAGRHQRRERGNGRNAKPRSGRDRYGGF